MFTLIAAALIGLWTVSFIGFMTYCLAVVVTTFVDEIQKIF